MGSWILDFLKDEGNQKLLAFYGVGGSAVIGALWAAYTFWLKRKDDRRKEEKEDKKEKPSSPQISMTVNPASGDRFGRPNNN